MNTVTFGLAILGTVVALIWLAALVVLRGNMSIRGALLAQWQSVGGIFALLTFNALYLFKPANPGPTFNAAMFVSSVAFGAWVVYDNIHLARARWHAWGIGRRAGFVGLHIAVVALLVADFPAL